MKITTLVEKETEVKTLRINLCIRDSFCGDLLNIQGEKVCVWEDDYVPNDLVPGSYGDYIELQIDIDTGKILNRPKLTPEKLQKIIADARGENDTEEE